MESYLGGVGCGEVGIRGECDLWGAVKDAVKAIESCPCVGGREKALGVGETLGRLLKTLELEVER
jgi:hypothetical protein